MENKGERRDFLKLGAGLGAALSLQGSGILAGEAPKPLETVRVGFVGMGVKGSAHVGNLLHMEGVELRAVCDIREVQCVEAQRQAERLGKRPPKSYVRGERDFEKMCAEEELDLVYTATPWEWHVPVCLAAMRTGKHAATEVPAATTLEDCWRLVEASEQSGKHCVMMENVNYRREEMTVLNMVRQGLLGELVHGEAGYMHDTRWLKIRDEGDGLWLGNHHAQRNGNLYPTHGLGPMAWYMNINRGDRFDYLVSMSSNARGMNLYAKEHLPAGHPKRERNYINGDVNSSLIRTVNGLTIVLTHDTDLPRPYSRKNLVQGTRGIVMGFPEFKVSLEAETRQRAWEPGSKFMDKYEHPYWKHVRESGIGVVSVESPKGPLVEGATWDWEPRRELQGGDFLEDYRLIRALLTGSPPDSNVHDAASWSVVTALSEDSVANRSRPVDFPDFTKGKWKSTPPLEIRAT